jgi:hypothetical protein
MAQATEMNTTPPVPSAGNVRLQLEGMLVAALYVLFFAWIHLGAATEFLSAKVLAVFFGGLIVIPLVTGLPLVWLRRIGIDGVEKRSSSIAAFLPFARLALYALQVVVVWVVTREAYAWVFSSAAPF